MQTTKKDGITLMRVIAMLLVLAVHTLIMDRPGHDLRKVLLSCTLMTCNGYFFMISGHLNLRKNFSSAEDTLDFYARRCITIVLPFVLTVMMMYFVNVSFHDEKLSAGRLYGYILATANNSHLWYLYCLIGMIFSTPILARAFNSMTDGEVHVVWWIVFLWRCISSFGSDMLNIPFLFDEEWILANHMTFYFTGYYVMRFREKIEKKLYIFGAAAFAATVLLRWAFADRLGSKDFPATYMLYVSAVFLFVTTRVPVKGGWFKAVLRFIEAHAFTVYLIHWNVMFDVVPRIMGRVERTLADFVPRYLLAFAISLTGAFVIDKIFIFPLQRILLAAWGKCRARLFAAEEKSL